MLLANISVARYIFQKFPEYALLRKHPAPPASNFEPLVQAAKGAGFHLDTSSSLVLAQSLENAKSDQLPYANTLLRILVGRGHVSFYVLYLVIPTGISLCSILVLGWRASRQRAACYQRRTSVQARILRRVSDTTAWHRRYTRISHPRFAGELKEKRRKKKGDKGACQCLTSSACLLADSLTILGNLGLFCMQLR